LESTSETESAEGASSDTLNPATARMAYIDGER
jgi:hypothetical protein